MRKVVAVMLGVWAVGSLISYQYSMSILKACYQENQEATEALLCACGGESVIKKLRQWRK